MEKPWENIDIKINDNSINVSKPLIYNKKEELLIQATFIGSKESLGYIPNKRYTLLLYRGQYSIQRIDGSGRCPYQSFKSFFENWTDIKNI